MMNLRKWTAVTMILVLSFCFFGVAFAQDTQSEVVVEQDVFYATSATTTDTDTQTVTQESTAVPEATATPVVEWPDGSVLPDEPNVTLDPADVDATTDQASTPEPVATAEPTAVPEATQEPETVVDNDAFAAATQAPVAETPAPTAEPAVARSANIQVEIPDQPQYGDQVTLIATLSGYEGANVNLQWQYTKDQQTWVDAQGDGASSTQYTFTIGDDTVCTYWRLAVTVL
jgi:hypothetical protein